MSGVSEPRDFSAVAVHVEALAGLQEAGCAGADDGGNSKIPRDNRAMRKHAAALDDERAGVDEQRAEGSVLAQLEQLVGDHDATPAFARDWPVSPRSRSLWADL